jgi:hypothetical protein
VATQVSERPEAEHVVDVTEAPRPKDRRGRSPWHAVVMVTILAVGAAIRLWQLDRIGFGGDEAVYSGQAAVLAGQDWARRYFLLVSRGNSNFLLYQSIVALVYAIWGVSDVAARLVSVAFSVATILVVYRLGTVAFDRTVGVVGAALLAISGYAVLLGRLALLDAAMTFFFTLALLCAAKWIVTERAGWFYAFAAVSALAIQTKITAGMVMLAVGVYLLITRRVYRLTVRRAAVAGIVFLAFLAPAFVQVLAHRTEFFDLLGESSGRASAVDWTYYADVLTRYDGYVMPAIWILGLACALLRRTKLDLLIVLAAAFVLVFYQLYPLKAYNYLLPAVPSLCLLGGRALVDLTRGLMRAAVGRGARRRHVAPALAGIAVTAAAAGVLVAGAKSVDTVVNSTHNAGLREAAAWLAANTPEDAGIMSLSNGSGQYVFSFYAHRDSYPFGRFRLATILPGGTVVHQGPTVGDDPPKDWITLWPPKVLADGTVDYLVYFTQSGEDPPETPLVASQNQRDFRRVIETYGGRLVHAEYYNHEGRVFIYEVHRLRSFPTINASVVPPADGTPDPSEPNKILLEGRGFEMGSSVTIYIHRERRPVVMTDADGSFSKTVIVDEPLLGSRFWILAVDEYGNDASLKGRDIKRGE